MVPTNHARAGRRGPSPHEDAHGPVDDGPWNASRVYVFPGWVGQGDLWPRTDALGASARPCTLRRPACHPRGRGAAAGKPTPTRGAGRAGRAEPGPGTFRYLAGGGAPAPPFFPSSPAIQFLIRDDGADPGGRAGRAAQRPPGADHQDSALRRASWGRGGQGAPSPHLPQTTALRPASRRACDRPGGRSRCRRLRGVPTGGGARGGVHVTVISAGVSPRTPTLGSRLRRPVCPEQPCTRPLIPAQPEAG